MHILQQTVSGTLNLMLLFSESVSCQILNQSILFKSKWCQLIIGNIKENEEESFEIPQKSGKSGHANTPRPNILPTG